MIEVDRVSYRYPSTDDVALEDISLHIEAGEIVGVVGPNGSGKSTLARLLKALLPPTEGAVLVDGLDTRDQTLEVRALVGLVFQNPNNQIVNSTVEYEVAFGPENMGLPSNEVRDRVTTALEVVGLQGSEAEECHSLSMARKQRVALAAVMAMEPRYIILDEPTAWIEPHERRPLLRAVIEWAAARTAAVILVTHRMEEAQVCRRLYGLRDGRLEAEGTPEQILGDAAIRSRLALEIPEMFVLIQQLRAAGAPIQPGADGIDALADALWHS